MGRWWWACHPTQQLLEHPTQRMEMLQPQALVEGEVAHLPLVNHPSQATTMQRQGGHSGPR